MIKKNGEKSKKMGRPSKHPKIRIVGTDLIFDSYAEVAEYVGGNRGSVYRCLEGDKKSHKGRQFEYVDDMEVYVDDGEWW